MGSDGSECPAPYYHGPLIHMGKRGGVYSRVGPKIGADVVPMLSQDVPLGD